MLTWNETRNLSYFPAAVVINNSTYTAANAGALYGESIGGSTTSISNGETSSYFSTANMGNAFEDGATFTASYEVYSTVQQGFTSSSSANSEYATDLDYDTYPGSTTNSSTSNSGSSTWTTGATFQTSTTATQEYDYTTTTTYESSTSQYTSSTISTSLYSSTSTYSTSTATSATTSASVTLTSNASWFSTSSYTYTENTDYYYEYTTTTVYTSSNATSSSAITVTTVTASSITLSAPIELGTVVLGVGNDWLWSYTVTPATSLADTSAHFLTDIASSFTQTTFWPVTVASIVSYTPLTNSNNNTSAIPVSNAASTTVFSFDNYTYYQTTSTTVTMGDEFARSTTTSAINVSSATTAEPFTIGPELSASTTALATITESFTSSVYMTVPTTGLSYTGLDQTTYTFSVGLSTANSYTITTVAPNVYFALSIDTFTNIQYGSVYNSWTSETVISKSSTQIITLGIDNSYNGGNNATAYFQQVPQQGLMQTPDSMAQTDQSATNLSFSPSIYYPFTSSVQHNVIVPIITNTSVLQSATTWIPWYDTFSYSELTTGSDTSWNFLWSSFSIYYTSATSTSSSFSYGPSSNSSSTSYSVWSSTSSTGYFSLDGATTNELWQNGETVFGGYSPASSATELGLFLGGALGTSYDTSGGTTTYATIRTSIETSSLSETAQVEQTVPVFITETNANGGIPVLSYTR